LIKILETHNKWKALSFKELAKIMTCMKQVILIYLFGMKDYIKIV
jgi:hypothetical protein